MGKQHDNFRGRIWIIVITLMLIFGSLGSPAAYAGSNQIELSITPGDYDILVDDEGFHYISMLAPGYGVVGSPGDPVLPERILEIDAPENIDWSSVVLTVNIVGSEVLAGPYNIRPTDPDRAVIAADDPADNIEITDWGVNKSIVDGRNVYVYGNDADYPEDTVVMIPHTQGKRPSDVGGFVELEYLRLAYRPFLYNPVSQELLLLQLVDIVITYEVEDGFSTPAKKKKRSADYVIVTSNDIVANSQRLDNFIYLKEQLYGHSVLVVTEDDFGPLTGQQPNGTAEKIREWLIQNYVSSGIDYVLLIGDPDPDDPFDPGDTVGDIPMKDCTPFYFSWQYRDCPTDWFYADLTGNWDLDGDGYFAESMDINAPQSPEWPTINTDYFAIRWDGYMHCDFTEEYEFHTFSDGGVRLYIDGDLVIDNWDDNLEHPPTNDYAQLNMTEGDHELRVDYKEHTKDAIIALFWKTTVPKTDPNYLEHQVIPLDHLKDETNSSPGLTGRYYNNIWFSGDPDLVRPDGEIVNYVWGIGDLGPGGPDTGAELFVGRIPVYGSDYAQLDAILDKIILYETAQPGDISWRSSVLLPMEPMSATVECYQLGEKIKNDIAIPLSFDYYRIYEEDYGVGPEMTPCNYDNVRNEWPNGYGLTSWATHGNIAVAVDIFRSEYAPELDDSRPAFTCQASCLTGYPESDNNLAYALLKNGAIATVAGTRVTIYGGEWEAYDPTSGRYAPFSFFYTKGLTLDGFPAGAALAQQKAPIAYATQNELSFNLYGDPECYLLYTVPNSPPVADAGGPYTENEGTAVILDAGNSFDPDGGDLEYRWDVENDGIWDTSWSASPTHSHTWCDDHTGTVKVEVRDPLGLTDEDTASVTILNVPPVVDAGPDQNADEGQLVYFSGSFFDPGCDTHITHWDFGDGTFDSGSLTTTHAYGDNGVYTVTLTVTDDDAGVGTDTLVVTVANVDPTITDMLLDQPNQQFILPHVHDLTFTGLFTDPGWLDTHTGTWDFGDGTIIPGIVTEENIEPDATGTITGDHVYTAPGDYTVTVTLLDDDGGMDSETMPVTVVDEFGALEDIREYIMDLPDSAFVNNPDRRKNALDNKLNAIRSMLEGKNYHGAIQKLIKDIRSTADGSVDGNPNNDWITDPEAQVHICMKIDDLVAYLELLMQL